MKRLISFFLPLLVLLAGIAVATVLIKTAPQTERKRPQTPPPTVEVMTLQSQSYQVRIPSSGTVVPVTTGSLVPEVSGRIVMVSDSFRNGGFFKAGEELLRIDPRDYQNAVTIARAELAQNKQLLIEEQARGRQAEADWRKLQLAGEPDPLVLRIPQRETVKAQLDAAEARLKQAELDLERTSIRAPYAGRVLNKLVAFGQFVSAGTPLAEIYASDSVEVRLPVSGEQLLLLELPEQQQGEKGAEVEFIARIGTRQDRWRGRLVRSEGSIDTSSRQLFVVARIDNPYRPQDGRVPLKIGQYLEAQILGRALPEVFVIPRKAVRGEQTVYLLDAEDRLRRRELELLWRDEQSLVASGPLQSGDQLSLTALPFAADGIRVQIAGENEANRKPAVESAQ